MSKKRTICEALATKVWLPSFVAMQGSGTKRPLTKLVKCRAISQFEESGAVLGGR